jgi:hypothetical protein
MRFDMTEIIQDSIDPKAVELLKTDPAAFFANSGRGRRDAEQANADFYYNLGADTQLEAVGEDDLDAHMQAPIFAQLTLESQEYLRDDEAPYLLIEKGWGSDSLMLQSAAEWRYGSTRSVWDRAEDWVASTVRAVVTYGWAVVLGLALAGIGWLELVSAA